MIGSTIFAFPFSFAEGLDLGNFLARLKRQKPPRTRARRLLCRAVSKLPEGPASRYQTDTATKIVSKWSPSGRRIREGSDFRYFTSRYGSWQGIGMARPIRPNRVPYLASQPALLAY